jgi:uncharacterized membrane protein
MTLDEYRTLFIVATLGLILVAASPTLGFVLTFPSGERFSELWVLGPGHMAEDYPFDVKVNETYKVFVGVGNHMGSSNYYLVNVKFRNQTESLPNATAGTPSPLPALYEYRFFVKDCGIWEAPLEFSFSQISISENRCLVETLTVNDVAFRVDKLVTWDLNYTGFYYQLFIELWRYNVESEVFEYHNRFVSRWLNVTGNV